MADLKTRLLPSAYAILVFFVALAGNAVRNLLAWPGFIAVVVLLVAGAITLFAVKRPARFRWYRLPAPVYLFIVFAVLSIIWSQYRLESILGVTTQIVTTLLAIVLAYLLTWQETLRTLATAIRYVLGLSIAFELVVALFVQRPILPWWMAAPEGTTPKLLYWSRDLLLVGGPIQGILGSSVLLGFVALLGLIVFGIQLRAGLVRPAFGWTWLAVAALLLALTRSATVTLALVVVAITLVFALWARRSGVEKRMPMYLIGAGFLAASITVAVVARNWVFGLLGKSSDLTGRVETWEKVTALAEQRPWFGWGWVSYWAPWVEPFKSLDVQAGLPVMHAHNAWLDVWFQLGIIGVLLFGLLVFVTTWRVWFRAIDPPRRGPGPALPYATSALWPLLITVALLVQSLSESRVLIEGGWLLLVLFCVKTRYDYEVPTQSDDSRKLAWRDVPIPQSS